MLIIITIINVKDKMIVAHSIIGRIKIHKTKLITAEIYPNLATFLVILNLYNAILGNINVKTDTVNRFIAQNI